MISVCIATYNGERFIRAQIRSILSQLSSDDEIVISDDGSTDNTLSIVHELNSPLIKVFTNKGQHGYTPNFENALAHAKGDYVFLSDQDDIWKPQKVKVCMEHLKNSDFVISDATMVDAENRIIAQSFCAERHSKPGLLNNLIRFSYLGCCMAFRKEVLRKALPFPPNHKCCTHDNWLALVGLAFHKTVFLNDKLIRYRRYGDNTSAAGLKKTTSAWFKLKYRLYLVYWLLRRISHNKTL